MFGYFVYSSALIMNGYLNVFEFHEYYEEDKRIAQAGLLRFDRYDKLSFRTYTFAEN